MSSPWVIWNSYRVLTSASASVTKLGQSTFATFPFGSSAAWNPLNRASRSSGAVSAVRALSELEDEHDAARAAIVAERAPHAIISLRLSTPQMIANVARLPANLDSSSATIGGMASKGIGPLEAEVLDVLWDASGWLTPGEVHGVISVRKELAYTTIMTVLSNLSEKGVLERRRDGRAFAYHPVQTREERTASTMTSALKAVENRPVVLTEFVGQLSDADRAQLRRMLSQ
jgi:predicted transcriptional regulator